MRTVFNGRIHRATVTAADVEYEGSITIDLELMAAANIVPHELVHVWNVTNGERLTTYALPAERGSGVVCLNGAAACRALAGDKVTIASFVELNDADARRHVPSVVFVDDENRIRGERADIPARRPRSGSAAIPATSERRD